MTIIVISGPSGVGKGTIKQRLKEEFEDLGIKLEEPSSITTRTPRADDQPGQYVYVSREEFMAYVAANRVYEHAEYGGNLYGSLRSDADNVLLEIEVQGAAQVKTRFPNETRLVFVLPPKPWRKKLEARHKKRAADSGAQLEASRLAERLDTAVDREIPWGINHADLVVVNYENHLNRVVKELMAYIEPLLV